ncbi:MAG: serine protease Do [Verrucomicrobiales bacterium]|jgi:serine protease Do
MIGSRGLKYVFEEARLGRTECLSIGVAGILAGLGSIGPLNGEEKSSGQTIGKTAEVYSTISFADAVEKIAPSTVTILNLGEASEEDSKYWKEELSSRERTRMSTAGAIFEFGGRVLQSLGSGSGALIDTDGHIVTNHHVVASMWDSDRQQPIGGKFFKVTVGEQPEFRDATLVGWDPATDLAVLKIDSGIAPPAKLGDSGKLRVGDLVLAVGAPHGLEYRQTVTLGVVSALNRRYGSGLLYEDFIQTDAAINPGNSGGPLINLRGEIVGFNQSILLSEVSDGGDSPTNLAAVGNIGIGFSISSNLARTIVDQIIQNGRVKRGWLGCRLDNRTEKVMRSVKVPGVEILEVISESPAEAAGLKKGDVIIQLGEEPIDNVGEFRQIVSLSGPAAKINLTLVRKGKEKQASVVLGNLEDSAFQAAGFETDLTDKESNREIEGVRIAQVSLQNRFGELQPLLMIDRVTSPSAKKAKLRRGMVVISVLGVPIDTLGKLKAILANHTGPEVLLELGDPETSKRFSVSLPMKEPAK